jgi:hypothetical protein
MVSDISVDFKVYFVIEKCTLRAYPKPVAFGSRQGRSSFSTAGIAGLFRGSKKSENAAWGQKMRFSDRLLEELTVPGLKERRRVWKR